MELIFEKETYAIRGAVFDVYREMGCGFLEAVYQECMEKELSSKNIPFVSQPELKLSYKGIPIFRTTGSSVFSKLSAIHSVSK